MKTIITNILVLLGGCVFGSGVNMGLIITGNQLIPMEDGMNPMDATFWEIKYFVFPFLAHAIGTLVGAIIVARYTASHHMILSIFVGAFFLLGGISMLFIMPTPLWFVLLDISLAYIPMGWYGWKLTGQDK